MLKVRAKTSTPSTATSPSVTSAQVTVKRPSASAATDGLARPSTMSSATTNSSPSRAPVAEKTWPRIVSVGSSSHTATKPPSASGASAGSS